MRHGYARRQAWERWCRPCSLCQHICVPIGALDAFIYTSLNVLRDECITCVLLACSKHRDNTLSLLLHYKFEGGQVVCTLVILLSSSQAGKWRHLPYTPGFSQPYAGGVIFPCYFRFIVGAYRDVIRYGEGNAPLTSSVMSIVPGFDGN